MLYSARSKSVSRTKVFAFQTMDFGRMINANKTCPHTKKSYGNRTLIWIFFLAPALIAQKIAQNFNIFTLLLRRFDSQFWQQTALFISP